MQWPVKKGMEMRLIYLHHRHLVSVINGCGTYSTSRCIVDGMHLEQLLPRTFKVLVTVEQELRHHNSRCFDRQPSQYMYMETVSQEQELTNLTAEPNTS